MSSLHWAILGDQRRAESLLRKWDPDLVLLDDARLPAEAFRAAVQTGHREIVVARPTADSGASGSNPDTSMDPSPAQP